MQIARAKGLLEIKPGRITHQIQLQAGVAHIAAHPTITAGIDAEPFEGTIGLGPQIDPAMGHLHRARQQQASGHGAAQQGAGQKRELMALTGDSSGFGGGDRHQTNAAPCGHRTHQPISHGQRAKG